MDQKTEQFLYQELCIVKQFLAYTIFHNYSKHLKEFIKGHFGKI